MFPSHVTCPLAQCQRAPSCPGCKHIAAAQRAPLVDVNPHTAPGLVLYERTYGYGPSADVPFERTFVLHEMAPEYRVAA